ncbi:MAG TPA: hypothetical protein VHG91_10350 [Longimicrobium sp.]|nr:hypothetical protein [Longimicrobium sp.]
MWKMEVRRCDDGLGVILSDGLVERLAVGGGDSLFVVRTEAGYLLMSTEDDARAAEIYERGSRRYANALRELSDS